MGARDDSKDMGSEPVVPERGGDGGGDGTLSSHSYALEEEQILGRQKIFDLGGPSVGAIIPLTRGDGRTKRV
jgi:hypothetical protein